MTTEVRIVGLSSIAIPTHRMRALRPEVVGELATSMTELSQLHPIVLRSNKWDGSFWLVAGRHRYEAAKQLNWACIRAIIIEGLSADQALLADIDENLARPSSAQPRRPCTSRRSKRPFRHLAAVVP